MLPKLTATDRVQAGSFAKQIKIGPPIVNDQRSLQAAIGKALDLPKADTFGPSAIWDAVALAVETLKNAPGRRAIILLTDGRATGNRLDVEAVAARAAAAGVIVNVVGEDSEIVLRQDATTAVRVRPGVALEFIANATGGLYAPDTASPAVPGPVLEKVLADLHERYTLAFAAPGGQPPTVNVTVKRPGVKIRVSRPRTSPTS